MTARTRLGKYEIRREIGRGAMGIVYEALDPMIGRTVAIKLLQPADSGHEAVLPEEFRLRFRREAQVAGRLGHPNIVAVHEYAEEPDAQGLPVAFIVMEFVDGVDLRAQLDAGRRFTLPETVQLVTSLLEALGHAHAHGVIHRDIKPANVMLCAGDAVKVADFGIARVDDSELTRAGALMGTVSAMAPEQLAGAPVDQRADLFSCGVILYELLTGEPPFAGSAVSVIQKVLNQEPLAPSTLNRALSPHWDRLVQRALAKKPADRFGSAAEFAQALRRALAEADPDATVLRRAGPPSAGGSRRWVYAAVPLAGLGALGLWSVVGQELAWWRAAPRPEPQAAAPVAAPLQVAVVAPAVSASAGPAPASVPTTAPAASAERRAAVEPRSDQALEQALELAAWQDARATDSVAAYQAFLRGFPKGSHARLARVRLAALMPPVVAAAAPAVPAPVAPPPPAPAPAPAAAPPVASPAPARAQAANRAALGASTGGPPRVAVAAPAAAPPAPAPTPTPAPAATPLPGAETPLDSCRNATPITRDCLFMLGEASRLGRGTVRDPAEALRWYRQGAELGDPRAQFAIGLATLNGHGVEKSELEGFRWTQRAAEQGHAPAQNQLGRHYEVGMGVPVNLVLAANWYAKAAEQGLADGQTNLGRMYLFARGVFKDTGKAIALFERAAAQGEPNAQYRLGLMAETGDNASQDKAAAARWYRAALGGRFLNIPPAERDRIKTFVAQAP